MVVEKASRSRRSIGVGNRRKIHVYICGGVIGVSILKSLAFGWRSLIRYWHGLS
jgi:hypothetical protein